MSIGVQKSIKEYTEDIQDVLKDLKNWEEDIKKEDTQLAQKHNLPSIEEIPPIRKKKPINKSNAVEVKYDEKERIKKDQKTSQISASTEKGSIKKERKSPKISGCDYEAWDKFDVDKALESDEENEEKKDKEVKKETLNKPKNTIAKTIQTAIDPKNIEKAEKLKEQGNVLYLKGKLSDAVAKYTLGIGLNPSNPLLPANRAMAYIKMKKFKVAEKDCTRALQLDPNYIKAFLRRATVRANLNNVPGAIEDYEKVLKLEPWNKDATEELKKLKSKLCPDPVGVSLSEEPHERGQKEGQQNSTQTKKLKMDKAENESKETAEKAGHPGHTNTTEKPIHLQSTKPLLNIPVVEVSSKEEIDALLEGVNAKEPASVSCKQESTQEATQVVKSPAQVSDVKKETAVSLRPSLPKVPKNSHQFSQDWKRVSKHEDLAIQYLKSIPGDFFSGAELEVDQFIEVASALGGDAFEGAAVAPVVAALLKSRGVFLNLAFLEAQEKTVLEKLISKIEGYKDVGKEELQKLKNVI